MASITINISGTVIEFPDSGASPSWAPAVIQFAEAVEGALLSSNGPFDVTPQVQTIDAYNPGISIDIPGLSFPTSDVRSVGVTYSLIRSTSSSTVAERGNLELVYNPAGPVGNKWNVSRDLTGDALISFYVTDVGQVQFTTTTLAGSNHTGKLSYTAKALLQD